MMFVDELFDRSVPLAEFSREVANAALVRRYAYLLLPLAQSLSDVCHALCPTS